MRFLLLTVVAAATIALAAGPAGARSLRIPHKPWNTMTHHQKMVVLRKQIHRDRSLIRFWRNHGYLAAQNAHTRQLLRKQTHWARVSVRIASRNLSKLLSHPTYVSGGWPPHHRLWLCISGHEGSPTSVNPNGHYGMLQMHADWGYGTSHHASDDPQIVQEWAAERAYKASGYAYSFLYGQWFEWDGADGCAGLA